MRQYQVQVGIESALVSFPVYADTPEKALEAGRAKLSKGVIWHKDVEVCDSEEEITGVY